MKPLSVLFIVCIFYTILPNAQARRAFRVPNRVVNEIKSVVLKKLAKEYANALYNLHEQESMLMWREMSAQSPTPSNRALARLMRMESSVLHRCNVTKQEMWGMCQPELSNLCREHTRNRCKHITPSRIDSMVSDLFPPDSIPDSFRIFQNSNLIQIMFRKLKNYFNNHTEGSNNSVPTRTASAQTMFLRQIGNITLSAQTQIELINSNINALGRFNGNGHTQPNQNDRTDVITVADVCDHGGHSTGYQLWRCLGFTTLHNNHLNHPMSNVRRKRTVNPFMQELACNDRQSHLLSCLETMAEEENCIRVFTERCPSYGSKRDKFINKVLKVYLQNQGRMQEVDMTDVQTSIQVNAWISKALHTENMQFLQIFSITEILGDMSRFRVSLKISNFPRFHITIPSFGSISDDIFNKVLEKLKMA